MGLTFLSCAVVLTTSLAARSDCLVGSRQTGWLLSSPSYGFCFRCHFISLACASVLCV